MIAIVLAAGYGTRLKPLTDHIPKALIKLADTPLIDIVLGRLQKTHVELVAINLHHHADMVKKYVEEKWGSSLKLWFSVEQEILDTGGGIKKIVRELDAQEPVLVHNVDILTDLPLKTIYDEHSEQHATVTLAVSKRKASRYLIFDEESQLCGRVKAGEQARQLIQNPDGRLSLLGFSGIQVISPQHFIKFPRERFSSIELYLHLAQCGEKVRAFHMDDYYWRDLGRLEELKKAEMDIRNGLIRLF